MGKTGKKGGKRLKKKELAKMLMELFQNNPAEVYDIKRIFRDLKLDTHPAKLLCMDLLEDLAMDDYIKETEKLHFRLNTTGQVFEAIFNRKANGKNTVTPLDGGEPVLVAERNSLHARRKWSRFSKGVTGRLSEDWRCVRILLSCSPRTVRWPTTYLFLKKR